MTAPVIDLESIRLAKGAHDSPEEGTCLLEAVAFVAGEPHTDHPKCASNVLGSFGRALNDVLPPATRQDLKPLIPSILGTANQAEKDQVRGLMAADWIIRTYTPAWLRLAGLTAEADTLAGLPELRSWDHVAAAQPALDKARAARAAARDAARAAARDAGWDAAWAAAWDAARDAAWDAAWAAARDAAWAAAGAAAWDAAWAAARAAAGAAARAAAWDAARDAARAAAGDAARAAARDALAPTRDELQASAVDLFRRMVTVP